MRPVSLAFGAGLAIVVLLCLIPVFGHLDHLPIQLWDESRLAVSALEMYISKNYLVTTYEFRPDMWSTKPPLMIWTQVLALHLFGINEIAIRLPSAVAAFFTCVMLYSFLAKRTNQPWVGLIAVLVLITAPGYVRVHGIRTGDYDALLTLLLCGYSLSFYLFVEEKKNKYLYSFFVYLTLATLTKGIAGLFFAPALLVYAISRKTLPSILSSKHFYFGAAGFLLFVGGYYLLREQYNPGYLKAVSLNELGGRFNTVLEDHYGDEWYYLKFIKSKGLSSFYFFVPIGLAMGFYHRNRALRQISLFSALIISTYLLVISLAATKLTWYDMPCYPFMAILAAVCIYTLFVFLQESTIWKTTLTHNILPYLLIICLFWHPYLAICNFVTSPPAFDKRKDRVNAMHFLKEALQGKTNVDGYTLVWNDYYSDMFWYYLALKEKKHPVSNLQEQSLQGNEKVIVFLYKTQRSIEARFNYVLLKTEKGVAFYQLLGEKT